MSAQLPRMMFGDAFQVFFSFINASDVGKKMGKEIKQVGRDGMNIE